MMDAVLITFRIISALRYCYSPEIRSVFRKMGFPLIPRLSFWIAIYQQAGLLTEKDKPSTLFHKWLHWAGDVQTLYLLDAWEHIPTSRQSRLRRSRVRRRLVGEMPLHSSDKELLPGLEALGICRDEKLTQWGRAVLGLTAFPDSVPGKTWWVNQQRLSIPASNPNWPLLWQLEAYLEPIAPFTYSLDEKNLRRASQRGEPQELVEILEKGTGAPLPGNLHARVLGQPVVQLSEVTVLEFSSPAELRQLRRSPALRPYFECLLSPRHISVASDQAERLLKLLERRGVYAPPSPTGTEGERVGARTHFPRTGPLQPLGPAIPLEDFIEQAICQQNAFELLYHATGGERPETHRITPMLIEERGGFTYVIAYSHTRKGQRTYRLDRMEVPGTLPCKTGRIVNARYKAGQP